MNGFISNLIFKLKNFMRGRYGFDELSKVMIIGGMVLSLLSSFLRLGLLHIISVLMYVFGFVRCFSFNFNGRQRELTIYMLLKRKLVEKINLRKKIFAERKQYKYFKCKNCKAYWRVPKGKGKVEISCRNCGTKMIKKT